MKPVLKGYEVVAVCPDCGAPTTFEARYGGQSIPLVIIDGGHEFGGKPMSRTLYAFLCCAVCHRGAVAKIHDRGAAASAEIEQFIPAAVASVPLPPDCPDDVIAEIREAESCIAIGAHRGASALLRAALEKTLKANGYTKGDLKAEIDDAAADGVITAARRQRAHDNVRDLGNDVVHDPWRTVSDDEVTSSLRYVQRIVEDFYDSRAQVEAVLKAKKRIP